MAVTARPLDAPSSRPNSESSPPPNARSSCRFRSKPGFLLDARSSRRPRSINLKLSDFPSGWRAFAPEELESGQPRSIKCWHPDSGVLTVLADARSQDFAIGEAAEANSTVMVFQDEGLAFDAQTDFFAVMAPSDSEECLQDVVRKGVVKTGAGGEIKVGEVDVIELVDMPPLSAHSNAWGIVIPFEIISGAAKGSEQEVHLEVATLLRDDTVAWVTTQDVSAEFDRKKLRDKLVRAVVAHMHEPPA